MSATAGTGAQPAESVRAWRPQVPGISEVFHAHFVDHVYPSHVHDAWTLLIVDDGVISYHLDRRPHGADRPMITVLPPGVAHDGRAAGAAGFGKRVVYLDPELIDPSLIGAAVDQPDVVDDLLRRRVDQLHGALTDPDDRLQAQSRLWFIVERIRWHLCHNPEQPAQWSVPQIASQLRDLLEEHLAEGIDLQAAADQLGSSPTQLIRSFSAAYGLPPHRYLTGRRVEQARSMLLDGLPIADAATAAGFYDQAHLTRHLRRMIGTTPARYHRSSRGLHGSSS